MNKFWHSISLEASNRRKHSFKIFKKISFIFGQILKFVFLINQMVAYWILHVRVRTGYTSNTVHVLLSNSTYPSTRLTEVSITLVACLLSFLDLWLLLCRCLCTDSGPLFRVLMPSLLRSLSKLTLPTLLTSAFFAAVLISLVLMGGITTGGGGGAFNKPWSLSEKKIIPH